MPSSSKTAAKVKLKMSPDLLVLKAAPMMLENLSEFVTLSTSIVRP